MNGKAGGYCIAARYGTMSKVDCIMHKFRPIAPKPVAAGSGGSGGSGSGKSNEYVKCGRSKRKYVRVNKNIKMKNDNSKRYTTGGPMTVKTPSSSQPVVTLSLLPETPDQDEKNKPASGFSDLLFPVQKSLKCKAEPAPVLVSAPAPVWLSFNRQDQLRVDPAPAPRRRPHVVVSNVTVECVTDTWIDLEGLGCTDEERVMKMEKDTCPGFISDGEDRVVWTNKAYRQMAGSEEDMAVVLVRKDKTTPSPVTYPAFTCKVRVTSAGGPQQTPSSSPPSPTLTLPCDVWRMQRGGACAWRLDVKAALSLGLRDEWS